MEKNEAIRILWDYLCLHQPLQPADCIIGFGCYNEDVGRRVAQLYRQGYAPLVLFSGGLGRNTRHMWTESEAGALPALPWPMAFPKMSFCWKTSLPIPAKTCCFPEKY